MQWIKNWMKYCALFDIQPNQTLTYRIPVSELSGVYVYRNSLLYPNIVSNSSWIGKKIGLKAWLYLEIGLQGKINNGTISFMLSFLSFPYKFFQNLKTLYMLHFSTITIYFINITQYSEMYKQHFIIALILHIFMKSYSL